VGRSCTQQAARREAIQQSLQTIEDGEYQVIDQPKKKARRE
jgi:hypothetical protein